MPYPKLIGRHVTQMFLSQILGTVIGAIVNYYTLSQVIDSKRPFLDGTLVDPTGQVSSSAKID